jgi:geranylgeranyl transferase type-1 subunit beta
MYLAFFILSALDLLDALDTSIFSNERRDYINWIYRCQRPDGGFRMWPGTDFGERADEANAKWDPANMAATYFALAALLVLGDDLGRVRRRRTLQWLRRTQRPDGSFGEILVDGKIEGGRDPRSAHCACGVRYILRGRKSGDLVIDGDMVEDVDLDALVHCIRAAEVSRITFPQPSN